MLSESYKYVEGISKPFESLTESQKQFIGVEIETDYGSTLKVVSASNKQISNNTLFVFECSVCSKDEELWPFGSIQITKGSSQSGRVSCGCTNTPRWTKDQYRVKVERECTKRGYVLYGYSGDYKGCKTYLDLYNPETGNRWNTTTISNLFTGYGDPEVRRLKNKSIKTIDCQQHISDFLSTGSFLEGTVFKRNRERKTSKGYYMYWDYSCPVCSNDEYVQAGLCSGVFTNTSSNLKSGKKSCRCIDSYRWNQEQRDHQINKICKQEGIIFIGWADGGYENAFSKILWNCGKNNHQSTTDDFINAGRRCGCYRETLHGFNPTKPASIYITRWYGYCVLS